MTPLGRDFYSAEIMQSSLRTPGKCADGEAPSICRMSRLELQGVGSQAGEAPPGQSTA